MYLLFAKKECFAFYLFINEQILQKAKPNFFRSRFRSDLTFLLCLLGIILTLRQSLYREHC